MRISELIKREARRSGENGAASSRGLVLDALRKAERFVLATHEHPDGDALGSLPRCSRCCARSARTPSSFLSAEEFPLPYEYRFLELPRLVTEVPADVDERTAIFLDCGNIDRNPATALKQAGAHILNIDHHHDNTRFGTINHVVPEASCTAEIVWDLMRGLGVELTQPIAEALYVGLVTDTGRFMYENTGSRAHVMAAELIDAGVDVHAIYRRLYEGVPQGKLELLARGLSAGRALRRRAADRHAADARGLRGHGRRGELLRGRRRLPARGRGHRGRRARARAALRRRERRAARSRCARPTTASTSR